MWSVLEAVYDGPIDTGNYASQPVILAKIPALKDGDAAFQPVVVKKGDKVADVDGNLVTLDKGVQVLPSGCSDAQCANTWDGAAPLKMDQLKVNFRLKSGLKLSDGSPLTSADSIYSYQVASDNNTPVSHYVLYRTAYYQALDDLTVQWAGVPGYFPSRFETNFWMPLPSHLWSKYTPQQLLTADEVTNKPVGWGPYVVDSWTKGDNITLSKNPNYFRAAEGLPKFDKLVFRFIGGEPAKNNLVALTNGECDVVDQTSLLDQELELILVLQQQKKLKAYIAQGPEWEHLDFGIKPAADDAGFNLKADARPDLFSDVRMRQAFAYCMDRASIIHKPFFDQSSVPVSYLPPTHPLYVPDPAPLPFDPQKGEELLDQVGWKDFDGDPKTPRVAATVANVPVGTPLSVSYYTSEAPLREDVAQRLADSLSQCGIQVDVKYLNPGDLFAPGPDGVLFGRKFDLAEFSWQSGIQPPCDTYETSQIPNANNNWLSINITGYSNPQYDNACQLARRTRFDDPQYASRQQDAERLFAQEIPSIPLFYNLRMVVARPDFCGLGVDLTSRSALWNIEAYDYGKNCN
jgi:peptide/nickel transport system substrate-binding protein